MGRPRFQRRAADAADERALSVDERALSRDRTGQQVRAILAALQLKAAATSTQTFLSFAQTCLSLELTPAQKIACAVCFDGFDAEGDLAQKIFGFQGRVPAGARGTAVFVCGRGSGKSRCFLAARALHLALTVDTSGLAPGEPAYMPIICPDIRLARQTLSFVKGFIGQSPYLQRMLVTQPGQEVVRLRRTDGREARIECLPATSGGSAVRGRSLVGLAVDECAFFEGEGFEVNDVEIVRAARPRLLSGSQLLVASTPWARAGLLWELYHENWGHPVHGVCALAPTLLMRESTSDDFLRLSLEVAAEREKDSENARREYDAEFLEEGSELFFSQALIDACVDPNLEGSVEPQPGDTIKFGADFGFASDASALVGVILRDKGLFLSHLDERRPTKQARLVPSEVVRDFAFVVKQAKAGYVMADGHYREAIQEFLTAEGLFLVDAPPMPAQAYVTARTLMAQGRVRIPKHPRLLKQLLNVRCTVRAGGLLSIHQPRSKDGGHGDLVSALVLALHQAGGTLLREDSRPKTHLEAQKKLMDDARAQRLKEIEDREKKHCARAMRALRPALRQLEDPRMRGFR